MVGIGAGNGTEQKTGWWRSLNMRDALGLLVFAVAAGGIITIAYQMATNENVKDGVEKAFSTLTALFGTWVGTLLAFYFSKDNFEAASNSLLHAVDRLTPDQKLAATKVESIMIRAGNILGVATSGKLDTELKLSDVCSLLKQKSRIVIFEANNSVRYIIHDTMVYKYIADQALDQNVTVNPATVSLADFLAHKLDGATIKDVVSRLAYVAIGATLTQARQAMLDAKGSEDVVVTKRGGKTEPVEGWITDGDIAQVAGS